MYAIIGDGGRQLKVEKGQELEIDYREVSTGDEVNFDRVLAYRDDEGLKVGRPLLESARVTAQVLSVAQGGPKLVVQKLRRRKNSRTKKGHRQLYTRVKINKIELG